jgi:hypothetical protein
LKLAPRNSSLSGSRLKWRSYSFYREHGDGAALAACSPESG